MALAAVTLFLAAALLFMVQPMTARHVLPLLGGTPAVWTTCMLFFQVTLLCGYWYAHRATGWLGKHQPRVHLLLLALPLVPLFGPALSPSAADGNSPVLGLLLLLATSVGLPFLVLATTAPLVQRWHAASGRAGAGNPYPLYAASNAGSLVGLIAYPALVEPLLRLGQQRMLWAGGYVVVAIATAACALRSRAAAEPETSARPVTRRRWLFWVVLAFVPSSLLLGVTTHVTTNLAPVPLLWVIPLSLYLVTFVIAFARQRKPRAHVRPVLPRWLPSFLRWTESPHPVAAVLPALLLPLVALFWWEKGEHGLLMVLLHLAVFFLAALVCHGRLADARPEPGRLTDYYLAIAVGGAFGGLFNGLVAPFLFPAMVEYPLMLAAVCLLLPGPRPCMADVAWGGAVALLAPVLLATVHSDQNLRLLVLGPPALLALWLADRPLRLLIAVAGILVTGSLFNDRGTEVVHRDRSVFGAHRVERLSPEVTCLVHGNILHGAQDHRAERRREPLTYFHREGPCGEFFAAMAGRCGRLAAVGLGIGTIAAYAAPAEHWTFFEIDAAVERTARSHFTYLADSHASVDVRIGDGRLELAKAGDGEYGVILLDAFNSDAVPVHLLTREALAVYLSKLAPGGVLAFHVSSRYVDLRPVLGDLAADAGLVARFKQEAELSEEAAAETKRESKWAVMARRAEDVARLGWEELAPRPERRVWTDDHSSLLDVLTVVRQRPGR